MGSNASKESPFHDSSRNKGDRSQSVSGSENSKRKKKNKEAARMKRHSLQEADLKDVSYDIKGFRRISGAAEGGLTSSSPVLGANSTAGSDSLSYRFLSGTRIPPADYDADCVPSRIDSRMDLLRKFNTTVDKLITHWPKYQFFRTVNPSKLGTEMIAKIIELFNHLLDQGDVIQRMAADNQRITQFLRHRDDLLLAKPLGSNNDSPVVKASNCRMPSPKLSTPPRSSTPSPSPDYDINLKEQLMSDLKRLRDSAAMSQTARRSIIIDSNAQNVTTSHNSDGIQSRLDDANKRIEELTQELSTTKHELDKLKVQQMAAKISQSSSQSEPPKEDAVTNHRSETVSALKDMHVLLDKMTLNEAKTELDHIHRLHDDKSKYKLLCAIIVESYAVCETKRDEFIERLKLSILNPFDDSCTQKTKKIRSKRPSVQENITIFEMVSAPKQRKEPMMVPESILKQAIHVASLNSNLADVTSIVNSVFARLLESNPRMMLPAVCESQVIRKYVIDSCMLCWQMVLLDPPLQLSVDASSFSDELHVPFRSQPMTGADIDYHLLPGLCEKEEGSILSRGRVAIRIIR
ncbi:uncharacterized protein LOC141906148 [Tubulanus polymorphus]|uniref:uncharacterized protein LOC141906148 n=1 Tax=Tubulanus polymorphus TaxID=672921 RepID=UPI003DA285B7